MPRWARAGPRLVARRDAIGAFAGPAFDPDDIAGYLASFDDRDAPVRP